MSEDSSVTSDATRRLLELKKKILASKPVASPEPLKPLIAEEAVVAPPTQYLRAPRPLTKTASPLAQELERVKPPLTLKSLMGGRLRKSQTDETPAASLSEDKGQSDRGDKGQLDKGDKGQSDKGDKARTGQIVTTRLKQAPAHRTKEEIAVVQPKLIRLTKTASSFEAPKRQKVSSFLIEKRDWLSLNFPDLSVSAPSLPTDVDAFIRQYREMLP